jgi:hypothetical protein
VHLLDGLFFALESGLHLLQRATLPGQLGFELLVLPRHLIHIPLQRFGVFFS